MSLIPNFNEIYQQTSITLGQISSIYRPDFTVQDQAPTLIGQTLIFSHPGGEKWANPKVPGVQYYTITGDRSKFKPGDIIIPNDINSNIPPLTVLNYDNGLPAVGFRTSRIANITQDLGTVIYSNVRFDFLTSISAEGGIIDQLSNALGVAGTKIIVWTRNGYTPRLCNYSIKGLRLVEADGTVPIRWVIKNYMQIENITVFTVQEEDN